MFSTPIDLGQSIEAMGRQGIGLYCSDVVVIKIEEDLQRYKAVIAKTNPDLIIQTGTFHGGSALWFVESSNADVVTIDTNDQQIAEAVRKESRIQTVSGNSAGQATVQHVQRLIDICGYQRVMVVLDSDHSLDHVSREIELYSPLVSPGCYLVIEDGIAEVAKFPGYERGPLMAIDATIARWPGWYRDLEIEGMYPISMNPAGWWRKDE